MKIITKVSTVKENICVNCMLNKTCGDVRGLCMLTHYGVIVSVIATLLYFLITMDL